MQNSATNPRKDTGIELAPPPGLAAHEALTVRRLTMTDPDVELSSAAGALIVVSLSAERMTRRDSSGVTNEASHVGAISIPPPDCVTRYSMNGTTEVMSVLLPGETASLTPLFLAEDRRLLKLALQAFSARRRDPDCSLLTSSFRVAFDAVLSAQPPSLRTGGLSPWQLRVVRDVIEAAATAPLATSPTLGELAEAARSSPFHFAREFRRTTGTTPYAYTLERRMARARAALAHTEDPVGSIGFQCGFASPSHFTRHFSSILGLSPSEFRALARAP